MVARSNPFATRYIQPGAVPYWTEAPAQIEHWTNQFLSSGKRHALVGPHGSGKSTLLHSLVPSIESQWSKQSGASITTRWHRLSRSHRGTRELFRDSSSWKPFSLVVLDGYEQLGMFARIRFWGLLRTRGSAGLVTCHRPLRLFSTLVTTEVTEKSAEKVIRTLLSARPGVADRVLSSSRWKASRQRWGQNLRESLFEMYDYLEELDG